MQDARPLDGVQLSKERRGFVDVLLGRVAKTVAVKWSLSSAKSEMGSFSSQSCGSSLPFQRAQRLVSADGARVRVDGGENAAGKDASVHV